ncbi:MAG: M16 family metallopeptidase [Ignavibacteria bacterium]
MKKILLILILFYFSILNAQNISDFELKTLDNGLKYIVIQNKKLPLVQVRIIFNGGASLDPQKHQGLTYLTGQLLLKGTIKRTAQQIAEEFEFLGSTINISTNFDYTLISTEFLKYNFQDGMNILAEIITSPALDSREIDKEKEKLISDLKSSLENPTYVANQFFNKLLFEGHPYSQSIQGTIKKINDISARQVRNHYKTYFIPNETTIILYGDVETTDAEKLIKNLFLSWQKGQEIKLSQKPIQKISGLKLILVDKPGLTQAQICVGNIGINQNNPDEIPISIVNTILGDGFTSRLVEEIRVKRSLTYGARSSFQAYKQSGKFLISTFTKNQTVGEVIQIILDELKKLKSTGVSNWEINKAKNYLIGEPSRNLQSPEKFVDYVVQNIFYQKDKELILKFADKIKNTSREEIQKAINEYFPERNVLVVVVGDAKEIKTQLEKFGKVQEISYENLVE